MAIVGALVDCEGARDSERLAAAWEVTDVWLWDDCVLSEPQISYVDARTHFLVYDAAYAVQVSQPRRRTANIFHTGTADVPYGSARPSSIWVRGKLRGGGRD